MEEEKTSKRGGSRPGAGRKTKQVKKVQRQIYMLPHQWKTIESAAKKANLKLGDYIAAHLLLTQKQT